MNYAEWMQERHAFGASTECIADSALKGPVMLPGGISGIAPLLEQVAFALNVNSTEIHIVGSSRYGFSLHDGAAFHPAFSDLDLAVVDPHLYARCAPMVDAAPCAARFPENDLPEDECTAFRRKFEDLSRSVSAQFAYVSVAVYPDRNTLVQVQAAKIGRYLGLHAGPPAGTDVPPPALDANLQVIAEAGLPSFALPVEVSFPANASPWLADEASFAATFGCTSARRVQLDALGSAIRELSHIIEVHCYLVGGSFVDLSRPAPNDLDVVLFYRGLPEFPYELGRALQRLTRKFLMEQLDVRFVPCDTDPWLLIKLTSFFTTLYQTRRTGSGDCRRGLVLIVPEPSTRSTETKARNESE